jgi:putative Mn2+ efflux pump MntP
MKYLNYVLIVIGAFVAMYAKIGTSQNQYMLIGGIVILMIGIYRIARNVPSRDIKKDDDNPE